MEVISKESFAKMVQTGAYFLANEKETINKLNVFPVPDGDTGTNMNLTLTSGVNELNKAINASLKEMMTAFINGLLMGARGNSGVILSQLFRGFHTLENEVISMEDFARALDEGVKIAYQSVTNPVEGTILTVAKDVAQVALTHAKSASSFTELLESIVQEAHASLARTPDLLPVLKEVGVVDSGGKGLLVIYEGFLAALTGKTVVTEIVAQDADTSEISYDRGVQALIDPATIKYGYCTEFFVEFSAAKLKDHPFDAEAFREELSKYGDSLLVAPSEQMVKVHIHTEEPGTVLSLAQRYGELINIDIENMRKQHEAIVSEEAESQTEELDVAIIAVAQGAGLKEMFSQMGATNIIDGGQTMNPSTEDFIKAIEKINAKHIFILPNNKNILLAAKQAAEMVGKAVTVIPTITIPQGLKALFAMDETVDIATNEANMLASIAEVKTGLVTFATRDTKLNGLTIKEGEFIGLNEDSIKVAEKTTLQATRALLEKLLDDEDEIVTIIYGDDVKEQEIDELETLLSKLYPDLEVESFAGNQPIYSYILMIE